jgi:hypothetical protein
MEPAAKRIEPIRSDPHFCQLAHYNNTAHSVGSNLEIPRKNVPDRVFIALF